MLSETEISRLIERIVERIHPQKVIIFGSYAKGTATIHSDLDILIVKDTHLPMERRADSLGPLLANRLIPVDVHVYTPEEIEDYGSDPFSFIHSVLSTGKVMFAG